jgi:LPS O-antigen subunit length determinant protein (WzzB/FepE family)
MPESSRVYKAHADEIDFTYVFSILWRRRKLIFFGTLAASLLAMVATFFIPRVYRSEGFYQLGNPQQSLADVGNSQKAGALIGVPIPLYKNNSPQFFNPNRLQLFADQAKAFSTLDLRHIRNEFRSNEDISKWIKPVYAYSKEDTREFAQIAKDEANSVIGLNISYEAGSAHKANQFVQFLGNYIRDCLLFVTLYDYIMEKFSTTISELNKNENDIIEAQFAFLQNSTKLSDIKAILTRYPESVKIENRQLVSVQDGGGRYLSPVTQLVGIESELADQRQQLALLKRQKEMLGIYMEYFSRCKDELKRAERRGEIIFSLLKSIQIEVFKNKDLNRDTVKEVANDLSIDLQTFDLVFFTNCRFISGPTTPDRHIRPRKTLVVVLTCFLAFFFFMVLALAWHWWKSNQNRIKYSE